MQQVSALSGLLGAVTPGSHPLEGKSFYLDGVKSHSVRSLTDVISCLGGKVESFLHKDVNVVITGNRDSLTDPPPTPGRAPRQTESGNHAAQRPATPRPAVCGSRGKALLEKAIRNKEKLRWGMLASTARSWGVKIVSVEDFLKFVNRLIFELSSQNGRKSAKGTPASGLWVVKAGCLERDFLKVEDSSRFSPTSACLSDVSSLTATLTSWSEDEDGDDKAAASSIRSSSADSQSPDASYRTRRYARLPRETYDIFTKSKYRPLHAQTLCFPMLSYTRSQSPFESPAPAPPGRRKEEELSKDKSRKSDDPVSSHDRKPFATPSPKLSHKKKSLGYCECCQMNYKDQEEHLRSAVHLHFVRDAANYAVVDRLVADMEAVFTDRKELQTGSLPTRLPSGSVSSSSAADRRVKSASGIPRASRAFITVDAKAVLQLEELQELGIDARKTLEVKSEEIKDNTNVPSNPKHETCTRSPWPEDVSEPEPQLLRGEVESDDQTSSAEKDLVEPGRLPSRVLPARVAVDGGQHLEIPIKREDLTEVSSFVSLMDEEKASPVASSSVPALLNCSSSPLGPLSLSNEVNPRKHGRSYALTPRVPKKMRISLKSGSIRMFDESDSALSCCLDAAKNKSDGSTEHGTSLAADALTREHPVPDRLSSENEKRIESEPQGDPFSKQSYHGGSSDLDPPQLFPFYYDRIQRPPPFLDPPALTPCVPLPSPLEASRLCSSGASRSVPSVRIESALVPDLAFSSASSESDWDSGLLSRLGPAVRLQPKAGRRELDLGLLLQSSCVGVQDGSYASRLGSALQPAASPRAAFSERSGYRSIETLDRRIVPSLGV